MAREDLKKNWVPTEGAFQALLTWLDEGVDSGGTRYLEIRRRLVSYFDRRGCPDPDGNADETLNRVARRLEEQDGIVDASPAHFCYLTAKFVLLESLRHASHRHRSLDEVSGTDLRALTSRPDRNPPSEDHETQLRCLENCIAKLSSADQELILDYYQCEPGEKIEARRRLAERRQLTSNALTIRAARIRNRLQQCVRACVGNDRNLADSSHQGE